MKKRLINFGVALFALILGLSMVPASAVAADYQWPRALTITSPAVGSSVYTLMLAWANKMDQTTGMKVRLLPENSIGAKWVGLKSGRFEMMNESSGILGLFILPAGFGPDYPYAGLLSTSPGNFNKFKDDKMDELLKKAVAAPDGEPARAAWKAVQQYDVETLGNIQLVTVRYIEAYTKRLRNYEPHHLGAFWNLPQARLG